MLAAEARESRAIVYDSTMLGRSWRFSRQLPTWSRQPLWAGAAHAWNVSSLAAPCSQRAAAAVTTAGIEAAVDIDVGQSLGEAATARPFSDIPGENSVTKQ